MSPQRSGGHVFTYLIWCNYRNFGVIVQSCSSLVHMDTALDQKTSVYIVVRTNHGKLVKKAVPRHRQVGWR